MKQFVNNLAFKKIKGVRIYCKLIREEQIKNLRTIAILFGAAFLYSI